jgi:hypothetical protein
MTPKVFLRMLLKKTKLRELRLHSPHYSSLVRYTAQSNVSPISVALSIMKNDAYFSHASAMWIHGLGKDYRNVFINKEQSQKDTSSSPLSQEAIHRAFRNKQRRSKLFYKYDESTITVLSGKHTARNGVVSATAPSGHKLDVTSIERTLIAAHDIFTMSYGPPSAFSPVDGLPKIFTDNDYHLQGRHRRFSSFLGRS